MPARSSHPLHLLVISALLPFVLRPGSGPAAGLWWDTGHRLVARIAELRLRPEARAAVREILGGQSLPDASVWADNIKQYRHDADPLHYVNIPLDKTAYDPARHCPAGRCIIAAIERDRRVLANPGSSAADRAEALRFLVHFLGDLHQPLHVADNSDRGGNERPVTLLGHATDLHKVWDGEIIDSTTADPSAYFEQLRREMDTLDLDALERGSVVDWAMEGHRIAAQDAYARIPRGGRLDEAYVRASRPLIDHALIAAGVRLAKVLNDALAGYRPPPAEPPTLGPGVYADREAAAHLGETATVVGTVASVFRSPKGTLYLNIGADYPRQTFTAVALPPVPAWAEGLDTLLHRRIAVHGRIQSYRGRVEIVLDSSTQITPPPAADAEPR